MFSTRSPTLTARRATIPAIGDRITAFASASRPTASWAAAACAAAWAASSAERASSRLCWVRRPLSLSLTARSSSRAARVALTSACSAEALPPGTSHPPRACRAWRAACPCPREPTGSRRPPPPRRELRLDVGEELRLQGADDLDRLIQRRRGRRRRLDGHRRLRALRDPCLRPWRSSRAAGEPDPALPPLRSSWSSLSLPELLFAPGADAVEHAPEASARASRVRSRSRDGRGSSRARPRTGRRAPTRGPRDRARRNSPDSMPSRTRPVSISMKRWWIASKSKNGAPWGGP